MRRYITSLALMLAAFIPTTSHAALNVLNGLNDTQQFLVTPGSNATNTMHMDIIQVGTDTHRFRWDGSPWRIDQGGTGVQSLPSGILVGNGTSPLGAASILSPLTFLANQIGCQFASASEDGCLSAADWIRFNAATTTVPSGAINQIQFNDGGVFGASSTFVFDKNIGFLGVGTSTQYRATNRWEYVSETADSNGTGMAITNYNGGNSPATFLVVRGARGTLASPQPVLLGDTLGSVSFNGFDGAEFSLRSAVNMSGFAGENWTTTAHGAGFRFFTTANGGTMRTVKLILSPEGNLSATGRLEGLGVHVSSPNETVVRIDSTNASTGGCIVLKDSDGDGYTYIRANNGVLDASTNPC